MSYLLITDIQPEPWTAPDLETGWRVVGRKRVPYPRAHTGAAQRAYQEALKECITEAYPDLPMFPKAMPIRLRMVFWRNLEKFTNTRTGRTGKRHTADATNLQKSTEDALQGILMANDIDVREVTSVIQRQEEGVVPGVLIIASPYKEFDWDEVRDNIFAKEHPMIPGNVVFVPGKDLS